MINSKKYSGKEKEYACLYLDGKTHPEARGKSWVSFFEEKFAELTRSKYAIACNSGTSALHMALKALELEDGDEIIIPALTVVMDSYVIRHSGAIPIICDVDERTMLIDYNLIESKISKKTKAIITVSLQGMPVNMDAIIKIAKKYNLVIIEDAAQSLMSKYNGKYISQYADITCFSFENKKHITSGSEGGMVVTNSEIYAKYIRKFGGIGYKHMSAIAGRTSLALSDVQDPNYQRFDTIGLNYRMNEISAAVGIAQIENIKKIIEKRKKAAKLFYDATKEFNFIAQQEADYECEHSYYSFAIRYNHKSLPNLVKWKEFYNLYLEHGGDGFYSACVLPHLEPVYLKHCISCDIKNCSSKNECKYSINEVSPIAAKIQKQIMQFKTNYRNEALAEDKANKLNKVLRIING